MRSIAPATGLIDLLFLGHPEYIGCYVLEAGADLLLVDPGPSSTLANLEEGLRLAGLDLQAVTGLLITHIHLDHAGACGTMAAANPALRVYVHERGARHLADPERLLASATRLYGDRMDELWGDFLPVPSERIVALAGGESLALGNRRFEVCYTPGHAVHHLGFFEPASCIAWVGDTVGIRIDNRPFVLPVTPPPDIDLAAWATSMQHIRDWHPDLLCPTHFGPARHPLQHIDEHDRRLHGWARRVAADLTTGAPDDELAARFRDDVRQRIDAHLRPEDRVHYTAGDGLLDSWHGLARHLRKQALTDQPPEKR